MHDDGEEGDALAQDNIYSLKTTVFEDFPGNVIFRASALFQGSAERVFSESVSVVVSGAAVGVTIDSPATGAYVNLSPITISGTVADPLAQVTINGVGAPVSQGSFAASVPLNEGPNTLAAVSANANGTTSTSSVLVILDTTPPHLEIYTPVDDAVVSGDTVSVTGLVNDIVVGTVNPLQAMVTVNGREAEIVNRTFVAHGVALELGDNTISVVAVDRAGNQVTRTITVTRESASGRRTLRAFSGNGQRASIGSDLSLPLIAELLDEDGEPVANTPVIFRVLQQNGLVRPVGGAGDGLSAIAINTDNNGRASVTHKLGDRAGAGNNRVEVSTAGISQVASFSASASPKGAHLIIMDSGNNQTATVGRPLPFPFIAIVTDEGNNRIPLVPVTFSVKDGGGSFGGQSEITAVSDSDGRVMATFTLGLGEGINGNVVEASFPGNSGYATTFTATGLAPGKAEDTSISGVVLDNSNIPLKGVTMRLFNIRQGNTGNIPQEVVPPVQTNEEGQFLIKPAPVGVFKLMADGGTALRPGEWPTLEFDMITVSGRDNTVGLPIYLPELLSNNRLCVEPTTGGTLTIPSVPGFSLTILPGSATFPGGSKSGCVSVTPVNMDKVPMVPGFGQQPRFVVTIQPVGTHFNPPAAITIPNVDGLLPRAVTEMYSYDHDLASFVAIGTGTVSDDGSVIESDPGVGVIKAGWHCGGDPNTSGSAGTCPECQKCEGSGCVAEPNTSSLCDSSKGCCLDGNCKPLSDIEDQYRKMISGARSFGWHVAADNLEHFLGATGAKKQIDREWLLRYQSVLEAAAVNENRFFERTIPGNINNVPPGGNVTIVDNFDRLLYAGILEPELFFASGGSTVSSSATITITKSPMVNGEVDTIIEGIIVHRWHDIYDWHAGLTAPIPGFGFVKDDEALCLIKAGKGKEFDMEMTWERRFNNDSIN
jgi:hypothetical protein